MKEIIKQALELLIKHHESQTRYTRAKRNANATCAEFKTNSLSELAESGYMASLGGKTEALIEAIKGLEKAESVAESSPTAGMNIAQQILHVGGRNNAAGYVEFGSIQAVEALVRQVLHDLPAPAKPQPLTDAECDAVYAALHRWAQKIDPYRFGLPLPWYDEFAEGRGVIRRAMLAVEGINPPENEGA